MCHIDPWPHHSIGDQSHMKPIEPYSYASDQGSTRQKGKGPGPGGGGAVSRPPPWSSEGPEHGALEQVKGCRNQRRGSRRSHLDKRRAGGYMACLVKPRFEARCRSTRKPSVLHKRQTILHEPRVEHTSSSSKPVVLQEP